MRLIIDKSKEKTLLPKIIRAALKLFVEKGIDGTTTKEIADKAGVSEGALYRHFKSKNELAWHIFSTNLNEFSLNLMDQVSRGKTTHDKIRIYISTSIKAFEEHRDLFTYLILSEHRELQKFPATSMHPGHVAMKLIEGGQEKGELRKMSLYVARSILVGSIIRLCVTRMYGNISNSLKNHETEIVESLWNALKK